MNTPGDAVDDLAIALGIWMASDVTTHSQQECFVESVLVLAYEAGIARERALRPFDVHRQFAASIWDRIEREKTK